MAHIRYLRAVIRSNILLELALVRLIERANNNDHAMNNVIYFILK
jgi:hypothetical protein